MKQDIPRESETIAKKREARIAEKLKRSRVFGGKKAWWSNGPLEFLSLVFLYALNFYVIYPFFADRPVDTFYSGPVIPFLADIITRLGLDFSYSVQIVNIFFFLLFPISVYLFIKEISGRKLVALIATLIASLPFYPFAEVRITQAFLSTDATHIASLALIPLALYELLDFLRKGGAFDLILSVLTSAIIALTSPFGFMTYMIFAFIIAFSEVLLGKGRLKVFRVLIVLILAAGINAFWYNPAFFFWMVTGPLGQDVRYTVSQIFPVMLFVVPVLATFGYLLFDRKPTLQSLFIATFCTISFAGISLAGGGVFPSHPSRYVPELGIALSLLLSLGIVRLTDLFMVSDGGSLKLIRNKVTGAMLVLLIISGLVAGIVAGKNSFFVKKNVLGAWDDVEKGRIWKEKEKFQGSYDIAGYAISFVTLLTLAGSTIKVKRNSIQA